MNQPQHRDRPAKSSRRALLLGLSAAIALPLLQGCFPVVATGVGAGAAMVSDRRTSGTYVEYEGIEWKVAARIRDRFGPPDEETPDGAA